MNLDPNLSINQKDPLRERGLWILALITIGLILAVEARAISLRYFVNDDYQMLYSSWLRASGKIAPRDYGVQSFHILPDLLMPFLQFGGPKIEVAMMARVPFWLALAALPWMVMRLAKLVLPRSWVPFAAVASLTSWPILERGLDIRPDLLLGLLWLHLLIRAVRPESSWRDDAWTGVLLAAAMILRAKTILLLPTWTVLLLQRHVSWRPFCFHGQALLARMKALATGILVTLTLFSAYLAWTHQFTFFWIGNRLLVNLAQSDSHAFNTHRIAFGLLGGRDPYWAALAGLGICWFVGRGRKVPNLQWPLGLSLLALGLVFVLGDPAFYSYNFVILLPLLSSFVAVACGFLSELPTSRLWKRVLAWGLLASLPAAQMPRLWGLATVRTNQHQVELARALEQTTPDTHVFALEGIGLFRPSVYDWRLSAISVPLYQSGVVDLGEQLRKTRPEVIVLSYRVPGWFKLKEQEWLNRNYFLAAPSIALLGVRVNEGVSRSNLSVRRPQPFSVQGAACRVDGAVRAPGEVFKLDAGDHVVEHINGTGMVYYSWPALQGLHPTPIPYLIPPDESLYEEGAP